MKRSDFGIYRTDYSNYPNDIKRRIIAKCKKNDNGCLEYAKGRLKHKYGLTSITLKGVRRSVPVHRALWMATHNQLNLPRSIVIRHKCDNPRCCNIKHLEPGTHKDNNMDMFQRGRQRKRETYKLHTRQCKFNDDQIRAIRNATGKCKWIAEEYGVSAGYVSKLRNNKAKTLIK